MYILSCTLPLTHSKQFCSVPILLAHHPDRSRKGYAFLTDLGGTSFLAVLDLCYLFSITPGSAPAQTDLSALYFSVSPAFCSALYCSLPTPTPHFYLVLATWFKHLFAWEVHLDFCKTVSDSMITQLYAW
jgi:hypothetical protein